MLFKVDGAAFYKRALLLPLLFFLFAVPLGRNRSCFASYDEWQFWFAILGAPYMLALVHRGQVLLSGSESQIRDASWQLPLWIVLTQISMSLLLNVYFDTAFSLGLAAAILTLICGYAYLVLINVILRFLRSVNGICPTVAELADKEVLA